VAKLTKASIKKKTGYNQRGDVLVSIKNTLYKEFLKIFPEQH